MGCRGGLKNAENRPSKGRELCLKRRQKSPNPTFNAPYSLLKSVLSEKKRTSMDSDTLTVEVADLYSQRTSGEKEWISAFPGMSEGQSFELELNICLRRHRHFT